ncbi:type II CRISPR RNA-guided endonuclease Cas9 [Eggerthia catenaformis]|uniref:type II CRISPR RNA-guided endonuclease Cas9 n=1 Tax=Eggerthia catenaformis TaxID=31973 RepID=UPI00047C2D7F|nr:type II CRISPR RNA-guided endonuclease Cas9 [Eggerthia catenaformis]
MKVSIGLDIGIASCGWSAIDTQTGNIDNLGVRLFTARNSDNNKARRNARSSRRLIRRRRTRLNDAKKYLNKNNFLEDKTLKNISPYELRVKGLNEELTKGEIYKTIYHIIKKRGISYLTDEAVSSDSKESYKVQVLQNTELLKKYTPGEIQLRRLKEDGRVRTGYNNKNIYILNVFTVDAYAKELERIFDCQKQYHPEITKEFIDFFINKKKGLVYRKRPYYEGPGNAANPSQYGRWANYPKEGKPANNIFDKLIGKDIQGKLRASSLSLSAQIYNLLNDMNNLTITSRENEKFTRDEKKRIIKYLLEEDLARFGIKDFCKFFNLKENNIKGWRVNNKDKHEIHLLNAYRNWKKIFAEYDVELFKIDRSIIDEIAKIVTLNTEKDAVIATIEVSSIDISESIKDIVIEEFSQLRNAGSNHSWHSFSIKTLNLLIPELYNTTEEQNTILERLGIKKDLRDQYSKLSHIPAKEIVKEIFNPTVSRSVTQSINVLNALIDKYGKENIEYITIEMPRDKNEDDQKKTIKKIQNLNAERREKSHNYFLEKSGWPESKFEKELRSPAFARKLYYYYEQDGKCAYTGQIIQPEDLLTNATEIDHIIPLSISLDDSLNNKVLVTAHANQLKGQRSPKQAFDELVGFNRSWDEYKQWVNNNKAYLGKKYKKANLLLEEDIYNPSIQKKFVNRNINDTRYSSRVVLNSVQSYFYGTDTKIKVVTGSFTHTLRKKWKDLEKTRETHHHHAVDASLCAIAPFIKISQYEYIYNEAENKKYMVDKETGEAISYQDYKKMSLDERHCYQVKNWSNFPAQLVPFKINDRIKFSHQVDKKWNRQVSDATVYSTRQKKIGLNKDGSIKEETYTINTINNIYTFDGYTLYKKNEDKLLMKELDPQTFTILHDISQRYPDYIEKQDASGKVKKIPTSPFKIYCDENNIPGIQKYSHKGNGPLIKKLKFYKEKLGSHINIGKDQNGNSVEFTSNHRKVFLGSLKPWRTDVYYDEEKDIFQLVGIKYNHLMYRKGKYGIPKEIYNELLKKEGISQTAQFKFSLYKKTLIKIIFNGEEIYGLYNSRQKENLNYFEMKPIDKSSWNKGEEIKIFGNISKTGQFIKGLKKGMHLVKIETDFLGNKYYVTQEKLTGILED